MLPATASTSSSPAASSGSMARRPRRQWRWRRPSPTCQSSAMVVPSEEHPRKEQEDDTAAAHLHATAAPPRGHRRPNEPAKAPRNQRGEKTGGIPTASRAAAPASAAAAMEVASSSSSSPSPSAPPPASSKPALRLNPAAVLLRRLPTPTPTTATPVTASASPERRTGAAKPLVAFLSSLIPWREHRAPNKQPDPSAAAARRAAKAAAEAEAEARQLVGCAVPLFRPYVAQLPWHGGARAWLSKLFPRYGHYCGPNWSSGKEAGSVLWDRRPVDHLDFCCYCHDMAYDTHDQAQLLRADLAFLRCLESSRQTPARDGIAAAAIYRAMCIFGLKTILIPYRTNLVRLQTGPNYADCFADFVKRVASSSGRPTGGEKQRL